MEALAGFRDSNPAGVEFMKGSQNKLAWESAGGLAFFIAAIDRIQLALGTPSSARFLATLKDWSFQQRRITLQGAPSGAWQMWRGGWFGTRGTRLA